MLTLAGNAAPTGFYDFPIEQSLRFNDNDSAYLSRTPASAGSLTTWTWSGWVKRGNLGITATLFSTATTNDAIYFGSGTSNLTFYTQNNYWGATAASFRDTSAWYHIVCVWDTTNATAADRLIIYVNNERQSLEYGANPALNATSGFNNNVVQAVGRAQSTANGYFDGYMADVNFIDGQALDPTSFGELKSGIWTPKDTADLTFGTNGFRLQFGDTTEASGFNAVTYTGNGSSQSISGVGFSSSPDLVWIKERSSTSSHVLMDSVRGASKFLVSNSTQAEQTATSIHESFDADGFTVGNSGAVSESGQTYVAWAWDAGSGSAASNTDGSITSTVKANTDYGFSIVSYAGNSTAGATIGHGLGVAPDMYIVKNRDAVQNWRVYHSSEGSSKGASLNATDAFTAAGYWNNTDPTSTVFSVDGSAKVNASGNDYIAYCFAEKTGYSKFGTYTGTGAAGNSITGLGFAPAFVMIKRSDSTGNWFMLDNTRSVTDPRNLYILSNSANEEKDLQASDGVDFVDFDSDGFTIQNNGSWDNASGGSYIFMAFADTRDAAFWRDTSGEGNDWQPNNLVFSDVVPDSTTNNFAVLNNLDNISTTYSEGNLKISQSSYNYNSRGSFGLTSGKYYWEVRMDSTHGEFGVCENGKMPQTDPQGAYPAYFIYNNGSAGVIYNNATSASSSSATMTNWTANDVAMIAYDADNGNLYHGLNGVWQNSADPAAGTGAIITGITSQFGGELVPFFGSGTASARNWIVNFGQDSTFAGATAAGGNADENGLGDFAHPVPSGFLSLCSSNLPTGAIDTLADETPEDYFNTLLWTGDGSNPRTLSGLDFAPDLIWHKSRSSASMSSHAIQDVVRGFDANNNLYTNLTGSETDYPNRGVINSVSSTGFTFNENASDYSTADGLNQSGVSFVAWNWKAGGTGVSNTDGSITSTVSVSETSQGVGWFSVVGFTTQSGGYTVGHGLGQKPSLIITKNRDTAGGAWYTFTDIIDGSVDYLALNQTSAKLNDPFGLANPTSSVFSLDDDYIFGSGDCIALCFANAENLCRVGSYVGNGSTDGTFIHTGFRPAYIMIKRTDGTGNWVIEDIARSPSNVADDRLYADSANAEDANSANGNIDFLSNGFKMRYSWGGINGSGQSYIYLAIAEQPFAFANAR
jgi:hypothetical protein